MFRQIGLLLVISMGTLLTAAQDTLPHFTLVNKGNGRIVISWTNPYKTLAHQLSIQRSFDSTRNFKTILTLPDPTVPQNGYVDTKAPSERMFYRIFILLDSGKYLFSPSKRPIVDTAKTIVRPKQTPEISANTPPAPVSKPRAARDSMTAENHAVVKDTVSVARKPEKTKEIPVPVPIPERMLPIKKRDTLIGMVGERSLKHFKDSILLKTKDTFAFSTPDTIEIKPFVPKEVFRPSRYVFSEKDGSIRIALPDAAAHKYALKFFDDGIVPVFEVKLIKDTSLIIDKTNFLHSGWFKFELYEDGVLKEKNKVFIPKDF